ncbi:MAG: phosphatase PAP2 family protein [Candidatus Dormibacteraeota bacterium]|nr:phosphatase PAP2 family protein [Candidatus Dormibacteraeota bacterium]
MQKGQAPAGADQPAQPAQPAQEAQKHHQALIRGRSLIALALLVLALFGAVTAVVLTLDPRNFDVPVTLTIQRLTFEPVDTLLVAVSAPGFEPWNFVFPLVLIVGVALLRRLAEAAFLGLAFIASGSEQIVKDLVQRARPSAALVHVVKNLPSYSFPSGHVTEYTLVFGFCFYLAFTLLQRGWTRTGILLVCAALVVLVGPSRIWMGQHWASDVLGGYTLGLGLLLLVIWAYRGWEARRLGEQADLPSGDQPAIIGPTAQK